MSVRSRPKELIERLDEGVSGSALLICESSISRIERFSLESPHLETGGVMAGTQASWPRNSIVTHVSDCGPNAIREYSSFSRDTEYCQRFLDGLALETQGEIDYLGEWHKHMSEDATPSALDIKTLKSIAVGDNYHQSEPLLLIIGEDCHRSSIRVFAINDGGQVNELQWKIDYSTA